MLGSQTWFLALACPTIVVGGFIASRKRLAYQWREELMDPEGGAYPPVTEAEMDYFRRVAPAPVVREAEERGLRNVPAESMGVPLSKEDNIGLRVQGDVLTPAQQNVYLNEVRRWSTELGSAIDSRKVAVFEARVAKERAASEEEEANKATHGDQERRGNSMFNAVKSFFARTSPAGATPSSELALLMALDPGFYSKLRFISDHAEDIQLMRAPWGSGDRMVQEKMPAALRHLVRQTEAAHQNLGRLRHVYVEYSPVGRFFREPRTPKAYDGHDYVIVPLRRDGGDTVITFAPALRSKFSVLAEVMGSSWTSRDIDAFVPAGGALRTYGSARYDWGWGVRPGPVWFGSRLNMINRAIRADERRDCIAASSSQGGGGRGRRWWWGEWSLSPSRTTTETEESDADRPDRSADEPDKTPRSTDPFSVHGATPQSTVSPKRIPGTISFAVKPDAALPLRDAALVVLHFEGPRAENKQRSLLFQPEGLIFGKPPTVEAFERWVDDRPTREDVQEEGIVTFLLKRYFEMLTVS